MRSGCIKCMVEWAMTLLCLTSVSAHYRGPHHPKGPPMNQEEHAHHHHYVPKRQYSDGQVSEILTHDKELLHDKEHLKEDMGAWIFEDGRNPTPEELEFHYFKIHDFDNNSKLDGLEILQALSHILPSAAGSDIRDFPDVNDGGKHPIKEGPHRKEDFNYFVDLIDKVLVEDDVDNDGYLSYAEYVVGRRHGEVTEEAVRNKELLAKRYPH